MYLQGALKLKHSFKRYFLQKLCSHCTKNQFGYLVKIFIFGYPYFKIMVFRKCLSVASSSALNTEPILGQHKGARNYFETFLNETRFLGLECHFHSNRFYIFHYGIGLLFLEQLNIMKFVTVPCTIYSQTTYIYSMTFWIGFRASFAREKYCGACARMSFRPRVPSPRCKS